MKTRQDFCESLRCKHFSYITLAADADAGQKILCDDGLSVVSELPDGVGTRAVTVAEIVRETFKAQWPSSQAVVLQLTLPRSDAALDWKETIVTSNMSSQVRSAFCVESLILPSLRPPQVHCAPFRAKKRSCILTVFE